MGLPEEPTEILSGRPVVGATPEPNPDLIGRTLGKFQIVERLGRGGSGEVFRAEQPQLGRSAVVKVLLREHGLGANRIERFLREAKLASRLDHPYAAHVYAFGAEPDGILWIAMEHVRGATLDELVARRGPMPAAIFAPLFQRLCEVVHTAHELGIVHRDIKGSNVMVIERAGQLLPKLLDFGIAKGDGQPLAPDRLLPGEDVEITGHGSTLGSPHYMSPEQWDSPADVDARSDVYALGVLAYRGVAGRLPFQDISRPGLPGAHARLPIPPLPDRVPVRLAEAILRALAKSRDARWPTAMAFGDAVQRAVGAATPHEAVPIFDAETRELWVVGGPQPIADAIAHLAGAVTTVEADAALRDLVAIACRWLAVIALATRPTDATASEGIRERARAVVGRDDGSPWLALARAAGQHHPLPGLAAALAQTEGLAALADRLDDRDRPRTVTALATDIAAAADALRLLEPLLAYTLVVGRGDGAAEIWQGPRRRERERVIVWGDAPLADREVALLDGTGRVVVRLSPLVQIVAPLPTAEPELFLLWRGGRGAARLVAAPWGFERDDEAAGQWLAQLTTEDEHTQHDPDDERSPYPGLAAYRTDDAERFVGREREIESIANRIVRAPMIAVLGPSGAGKSSFIHAGVLPRLAEHYSIVTLRPGRHPLHALAALPSIGVDTEDGAALVDKLRALGEQAPRGLVIVIDQLEELVTLCSDPRERARFAETLAAVADTTAAPVRVVVTLRDDFASVIESEAALRGKFDVFVLAAPSPEALRRIVTEPARRANVTVDPQVVDDMVAEVVGRPASLPLLSFTAAQLWQSRDKAARRITHEAYAALGGVAGALSTYADEIYDSLARSDQEIVRQLFGRLVATDGTRIPAVRAELEQLTNARRVLAHLIDARLVVVREDDDTDIVEIVHECLAERWQRLARWRREDAADRAVLADLRIAARRWHDANRATDRLWRGRALDELRRLIASSPAALTDVERAFAEAADRAARRARRVRRTIVAAVMVALAVVAIAMASLGIAANHSRAAAERSATDARDAAKRAAEAAALADDRLTQSLVAQGKRELNDGRGLAALAYFAEALRRGTDTPALRFMIALAERAWPAERLVVRDRKISAIALTPTAIVAGDQDGAIHWWTRAGEPTGNLALGLAEIHALILAPHDPAHATAIALKGVAVVDLATHAVTAQIAIKPPPIVARVGPGADEVTVVEREAIVVYGFDGKPRRRAGFDAGKSDIEPIWGAGTRALFVAFGTELHRIDLVTMAVTVLETRVFDGPIGSADGTLIAWLDRDHVAHLADPSGKPRLTFRPANGPSQLVVSPDGARIGAIADRSIMVYEASGKEVREVPVEPNQGLVILRGDDLWSGTSVGLVRHYQNDVLVASLPSHVTELEDLRLEGDLLATVGSDGTLVVLDADAREVRLDADVCTHGSYNVAGNAIGYDCEDKKALVLFIGHRRLGTLPGEDLQQAVIEPTSKRAAAVGATHLVVFDPDGKELARSAAHLGPIAFVDAEHLLVVDPGETDPTAQGLYRWTVSGDRWERLDAAHPSAIVVAAGGAITGDDRAIVLRDVATGKELHRAEAGDRIDYVTASADRRWVAATTTTGGAVIVDGTTGAIVRTLAPADAVGYAATLDAHGDLLIRASRGALSIWDPHSGDELLWAGELLRAALTAVFADDGHIELAGRYAGELAIPAERRSVAEVLRAIDCRVPLKVSGSRLEPRARSADCK